MSSETNRHGRTLVGVVSSDKMDKTVVVAVTRKVQHKRYKKYVLSREKYKAHDEKNEYRLGDKVTIVESRPRSREKRWRVQSLLERPDIV